MWFLRKPSNDREWTKDQKILPKVSLTDELITIENIRDLTYESKAKYDETYFDKSFTIDQLKNVWFIVESLTVDWDGPAHTMLSFELNDGEFISISIEIRKQKGQRFSPLRGMFNAYEIMYVIAAERDALFLRTNIRKDKVYLYKACGEYKNHQALFIQMLERAEKLRKQPEFYNTVFNSCTTNIVKHIRKIIPGRIPYSYKVLLSGYSDKLAYDVGLIDNTIAFEQVKAQALITGKAQQIKDRSSYSEKIRSQMEGSVAPS